MVSSLSNWLALRLPFRQFWRKHFSDYWLPSNLNIWYLFGSLALFLLINQFVTGIWLTMFYTPSVEHAFASVQGIMRDVHFGWLIRYLHAVGASALFVVLYLHIFRSLMYGSYLRPRELVWLLGMMLLCLMMLEAFCGYLLPWGQLSYWGAQVITSLVSAVPYVGDRLLIWLRGDFAVGDPTLHRFFALHAVLVPLLILLVLGLYIVALRQVGSNNPHGIDVSKPLPASIPPVQMVRFHPHYTVKDLLGLSVFLTLFLAAVFFAPTGGGYVLEPANLERANPMVTPEHIAPAWYLAPFYSMLRAIPARDLGIIMTVAAVVVMFALPWLDHSEVRSMRYRRRFDRVALAALVVSWLCLLCLGTLPLTPARQWSARLAMLLYFAYFLLIPVYSRHQSIDKQVGR